MTHVLARKSCINAPSQGKRNSRPSFDHNTRRGFYGAMLSRDLAGHKPYVYGLLQRDYNDHDTLITGPVTTRFDYNSYYLAIGSSANRVSSKIIEPMQKRMRTI